MMIFSVICGIIILMKGRPVIVGVDIGSWTLKICAFNGEKLEVLTNEANFRETPSLVGYTPTERLIGQPAIIKLKTNFQNTLRAPQRLLAISNNPHLLPEELKYQQLKYEYGKDLVFRVEGRKGAMAVTVQEVLLSLLGKVKSIVQSHGLALAIAYIAVPTYFSNQERAGLLRCSQLALKKPVRLVDDWAALAAQYTYNRLKQLRILDQMRNVVFLDIGYSKVSINLVQFTRFEGRLLDWQHLPFTGCKNMDHLMCEFYSGQFERNYQQSLLEHGKPMVKLMDAVQRQRTVLSANNDYHLNLEYILNEEDLTYNMKRQQMENIIVPVLSDMASAMAALQSRNCSIPIHAVELMGGASRIPCVQAMAAKIFGMEPSRGLNQSEAIATGSTILGATERKVLNLQYSYDTISTKEIAIRWGKQRHSLFCPKQRVPAETALNIGNEGTITATIFIDLGIIQKQIGRVKFKTPNKLTVSLDEDKIMHCKVSSHVLQQCQLGQKGEQWWKQLLHREQQMSLMDLHMGMIYQMKNDYESKLYSSKNKLKELRPLASPHQLAEIEQHINMAEKWIEEEHAKPVVGAEEDLKKHQQKNTEIAILKALIEELDTKRRTIDALKIAYDRLGEQIGMALQQNLSEEGRQRVMEVMNWGQEAYQAMENHNWDTDQLTIEKLQEAGVIIRSALAK